MAKGVAVITVSGKRRRIGHGMWQVCGAVTFADNDEGWFTCAIEGQFRRCQNIEISIDGGAVLHWNQSTTHMHGHIASYTSTKAASFAPEAGGAHTGTFRATGM